MNHLRLLRDDMIIQDVISTTFDITYNTHPFSCIFIIGLTNHQLYITTIENHPQTIFVSIDENFTIPSSLSYEDYIVLADYLGFTPSRTNPFKPNNFFEQFDNYIPTHHTRTPAISEMISVVSAKRNVADADKIYFVRWRRNSDGEHVSNGNYIKTCSIVGEEAANILRENNISSCWSDIPQDEQLNLINQYEDLL